MFVILYCGRLFVHTVSFNLDIDHFKINFFRVSWHSTNTEYFVHLYVNKLIISNLDKKKKNLKFVSLVIEVSGWKS
jgi:uncharacterized protein YlbG (UPF0298 family)